ncbi:hypothetical protein [Helicobacter pylori]|uniref:hypothetical protein n=1 Tax=Helicobacter pylori TaxID=210 RepID=UPI00165BF5B8|nr:hypothetical protein [Helicobacter pylori]MBH0254421.1 hypothetical protein [Helicobacter pylori]
MPNLDVATGLNYHYKHSKYSVGISIPLIQKLASFLAMAIIRTLLFSMKGLLRCFFITGGCFEREMS